MGGGSFPPADRTLTYPIEYYVSRNTVKSANVWDIAMLLNFLMYNYNSNMIRQCARRFAMDKEG